jgi:hypothetical protein
MFSMPAGTPAKKVLEAVRNFAREEFGLKHRYAMVLHTDEPHPHVHVVVKAVSEQGLRLHIRKATLREWRRGFAGYLRALGVAANATERSVRGQSRTWKWDGIYRAAERGASTHMRERVEVVAKELAAGNLSAGSGKAKLEGTRREVVRGWMAMREILVEQGQPELAAQVRKFLEGMPAARTDKEQIAEALRQRTREPPTR